jgi:hypothetical protein
MSTEPEYSFGPDEMRKVALQTRIEELDFKRAESDRELRRWCIEVVAKDGNTVVSGFIEEAEKIYDWVRNQPPSTNAQEADAA